MKKGLNRLKHIILSILLLTILSFSTYALCTVTMDQATYTAGDTASVDMICDQDNEENRAYTLTWRDADLVIIKETDAGSTPATKNTIFNEDYVIPEDWPSGNTLSATLTGLQLEGSDTAIVYTAKSINATLDQPSQEVSILINGSFIMTCTAGNDGGGTIYNVTIEAQYINGSNITGQLSLNESNLYECGSLNESETCTHSWNITGNSKSVSKIHCFVEDTDVYATSESRQINIFLNSSDLTISLDSTSYAAGESSTVTLTSYFTDSPYSVIWYNSTGGVICNETGTTPALSQDIFFENCVLPADIPNQFNNSAVFYLNSAPNLSVTDYFDIGNVSALEYIVTNVLIKYDTAFLGYSQSIKGTVKDSNGDEAIGECCRIQIDDAITGAPIFTSEDIVIDGLGSCEYNSVLGMTDFEAPKSYAAQIIAWQCSDEDLPSSQRKYGSGLTSFDVAEYFTEEDELIPVVDDTVFAGFEKVEIEHSRTNNFGQPMEIVQTSWFANIITEQDYHYTELVDVVSTVNIGNSIVTERYAVPFDLPAGQYRIEKNMYYLYQGTIKEFRFVKSDPFNVTPLYEAMTINSVVVKDYFDEEVTTSSFLLSSSDMPVSNYTHPHYMLAEGFGYKICGDITNHYDENIYWHMENLILHNPETGNSFEEFHRDQNEVWQRVLAPGNNEICWNSNIPLTIDTHSDWNFLFDIYLGSADAPFICDDYCVYTGQTSYFYIGAIEDMVQFTKWIEKPTNTSVGIPATFIVSQRENYLSHNDDCEYKTQNEIPWGTANVTCYEKNDNSSQKTNYHVYPIAGEQLKVCYQIHNYFSDEIDLELYDMYVDDDSGETVLYFQEEETENYVPSITDDKLYLSETPSRAYELDGILVDGYSNMCTKWISLPHDMQGGNDWDVQGKVRISSLLYNLEKDIVWNWESDEFPIFGREEGKFYPNYLTINEFYFTHDNATEGEYFRLKINISNNLPEYVYGVLELAAQSDTGNQKVFGLIDYDTEEVYGDIIRFDYTFPPFTTEIIESPRFKISYGFKDLNENDVIDAFFNVHVLDGRVGNVMWTQSWEGATPDMDIIAKDIEVINLTSTAAGGNITACNPILYTLTYNNVVSDTHARAANFVLRGCVEDVTNDIYLDCSVLEIEPDEGTSTGSFLTDAPFVLAYSRVGVDVWLYTYDADNDDPECLHCGDVIDFYNMADSEEFFIIPDYSDECKYTQSREEELEYEKVSVWLQIWTVLQNWYNYITGGTNIDTLGNYTDIQTSLVTSQIGSSDLQINYNITGNSGTIRTTLHFIYEFSKTTDEIEGAFEDQNPSIKGYQALSYYQAVSLNQTKIYLLTLDPNLNIGNYTMYETIYEVNEVQPTSDGNFYGDERIISQKSYTVEVDTEMTPDFDGDIIQLQGASLNLLS